MFEKRFIFGLCNLIVNNSPQSHVQTTECNSSDQGIHGTDLPRKPCKRSVYSSPKFVAVIEKP